MFFDDKNTLTGQKRMTRVGIYTGLLILIIIFPATGFAGSMGIRSSKGFVGIYRSSKHGHYGKHIDPGYTRQHFVMHRSPKRWSLRFVKCYYPMSGIWTQGYNSGSSIIIEQINIILSPTPEPDTPERASEKKGPPPPHMEILHGEENTSNLNEEAGTNSEDARGHIVVYGQEKP